MFIKFDNGKYVIDTDFIVEIYSQRACGKSGNVTVVRLYNNSVYELDESLNEVYEKVFSCQHGIRQIPSSSNNKTIYKSDNYEDGGIGLMC